MFNMQSFILTALAKVCIGGLAYFQSRKDINKQDIWQDFLAKSVGHK